MPIISATSAARQTGYVFNYTQMTSNFNVTDTSEATATAMISPGAITFDGAAVWVEFFSPAVTTNNVTGATDFVIVTMFEGATQIGRLGNIGLVNLATGQKLNAPVLLKYRFTPSAASHTYTICAFTNNTTGTPQVAGGAAGTSTNVPAYVLFSKA